MSEGEEQIEALPLRNIGEKRARVSASAPAPAPALSEEISPFSIKPTPSPTPSPTLNPTNRTSTEPNLSFLDRHGAIITFGGITALAVGGMMGVDVVSNRIDRHYRNREQREQRLADAANAPVDLHQREDVEAPPPITRENAARFSQESAQTPPPPVTVV